MIPKPDGSLRLICIPSIQDRLVQQITLEYIREKYPDKYKLATDYDFSSKKEEGGAIRARCVALDFRNQYSHVLKTDISAFFDNLDRKIIKKNMIFK
ncbi:reverse transcriptase domain-containing protein [Acinetobacter radioresistens]|uniref:reverse transcriptase domain-containing protein n=1 Tax=Acinetobacter radioresistens TaxID=40216 RepID=UPI00226B4980|nr:reverse transcriptase domain-containing protein [Acinetobacter radioresistens]